MRTTGLPVDSGDGIPAVDFWSEKPSEMKDEPRSTSFALQARRSVMQHASELKSQAAALRRRRGRHTRVRQDRARDAAGVLTRAAAALERSLAEHAFEPEPGVRLSADEDQELLERFG